MLAATAAGPCQLAEPLRKAPSETSSSPGAVPFAFVAATVIEVGGVTTGAVKSAIVNTAVAVAGRFEESAMLKVTVVAPIGNTSGASLPIPSVRVPSTLSVDVAVAIHAATSVAVLAEPSALVAVIVVASGGVITGGD